MSIGSFAGNGGEAGKHNPSAPLGEVSQKAEAAGYHGGTKTDLSALATDNITEVLLKILEFTQNRQKILIQNINAMHRACFEPKDLAVEEFAGLMFLAISEHINSRRLLLCDGDNVKFGAGGSFEATPIVDEEARRLLAESRDEYLRDQVTKLLENSLNQRIATRLLRQKQSDELCRGRCMD